MSLFPTISQAIKVNIDRRTIERAIFILIIIGLVIYGLKDSDTAVKLINAVIQAFSFLSI